MVSTLARRAMQTTCRRAFVASHSRQFHISSSAQDSWFGRLLRGSKPAETPETPQHHVVEETKPQLSREVVQDTPEVAQVSEPIIPEPAVVLLSSKPRIKRTPLTPKHKQRRFDENISFMEPRLGRQPKHYFPLIRKNLWVRTLALCQTEEQLRRVMELIPSWSDMGHQFDTTFSLAFIRRCLYLNKPEIALELFGNYGKYNVPLSLPGARELLNAAYDTQPLGFVVTLTSLFDAYQLQLTEKDFSSCAMLVAACFKKEGADNEDAKTLGLALLTHLRRLLRKTGQVPPPKGDDIGQKLPEVWGIRAMKKVEERLPQNEKGRVAKQWVHAWRVRNGHVAARV